MHLNAELGAVVVYQRAHVRQSDDCHLAVADLDEHGRILGLCGARDGHQGFLVVDIEGSHCSAGCNRELSACVVSFAQRSLPARSQSM